ncbi:MAG: hypothetical protein JNM39_11575 [Bdellovibrionaceae bacterium]|nr:hypothetical protein [Pseudobdellovibrionaceae bacterium]
MNIKLLLLITITFFSLTSKTSPVISAEYEQERTSDQFQRNSTSVSFDTCRRDLFWPYVGECSQTLGWGLQFKKNEVSIPEIPTLGSARPGVLGSGLKLVGSVGTRLSPNHHLDIEIGGHSLNADPLYPTMVAAVGMAQVNWKVTSSWDLSFSEGRDLVYNELKLPAAFSHALTAWTFQTQSLYRLGHTWRFPIRGNLRNYSDENSSWEYDLAVLYGVSPGTPWIWVGLGFNQLSYQIQKSDYWTPKKVTSDGPRLEWDIPLYGKLSFSGGANFNHIAEQNAPEAEGYVALAGLKYGLREGFNMKIQYFKIETTQLGKAWSSDSVSFTINN